MDWKWNSAMLHKMYDCRKNKLQATLVRNYHRLTDEGEV